MGAQRVLAIEGDDRLQHAQQVFRLPGMQTFVLANV
ncbi:hypothetical protein L903_24995 [Agrobacterium sp. JL28]|nr:hypothetical protein L902_04410 [Agrobacterium radiobacter DSM 30147]KVK45712.1 hypothetical protein L904_25100 [Agrobacterium sp. LY4]KVK45777.1 hypothetical protein L903_24995 [Agrobacterium sp. JL28]